jgi:hypothetical protein
VLENLSKGISLTLAPNLLGETSRLLILTQGIHRFNRIAVFNPNLLGFSDILVDLAPIWGMANPRVRLDGEPPELAEETFDFAFLLILHAI